MIRTASPSAPNWREGLQFHLILNAYWEPLDFELPQLSAGTWRRWIDTALDSPNDIVPWEQAPEISGNVYPLGPFRRDAVRQQPVMTDPRD